ncbi:hypothetical protein CERSUDRAFT_69644 [Gelatoporia subvermispora B]|uniref:HAT C-terminal dimerisation domain-containing protein n=1 Tax=Ceriporiopsis subvermispora (strain B) TaxID=914234 RepID=M2Q2I4_CERS8|nr:hypothetical protein CERSUDRAFT_69644 [Gelatoporia subvermispora B]
MQIFRVTSDNASNNNTMMRELAQQLRAHHQIEMNSEESRIGFGLIRAISVKERSSSQHKQHFRNIQSAAGVMASEIKGLVIDMKVRWSSTYMMLNRAYSLRKYVVPFLHELARSEDLSKVQRNEDPKYAHFKPGLEAGLRKIEQYYERVADNDAYIMSMVLDPQQKLTHIKENWTEKLHDEALAVVQKLFRERYYEIYPKSDVRAVSVISRTGSSTCVNHTRPAALAELSSNEEELNSMLRPVQPVNMLSDEAAAEQACKRAFCKYLELDDGVPEGMEIVQWWGLNGHHYPVWASLARDYLAIMATSVSSKRTFSSAGITITKWRNRLKGDIVEALQLLKSALRKSLFLFECGPSSTTERRSANTSKNNGD